MHSKNLLCLGSFSFEIQEKKLQKLVNSGPQPCRWMKLPKKHRFEWFGDHRTLWLLQAVQKQQRQGAPCPQSILHLTNKKQSLAQFPFLWEDEEKPSASAALVGTVSLLFAGVWWGKALLCWECVSCRAMHFWGTSLRGYSHLHPGLEEGSGSWVQVSMTITHQIAQKHFQKYFRCQIECWNR